MVDIKILKEKNYDKISEILLNSYVPQWGSAGTPVWNPSYVEYLDKAYLGPDAIYIGAYDEKELIGVGTGYFCTWNVSEAGKIKAIGICNFGILPDYQRKGIATDMVNTLLEEGKSKGAQIAFRTCNEDLNDWKLLEKIGFEKKINNANQFARIMGKDMADFAADIKDYGAIMKRMVKMVSGLPDEGKGIEEGSIRDGNDGDITKCVEIMNNYSSEAELLPIWTEDEYKRNLDAFSKLEDPFNAIFKVWDIEGDIKAFAIGRTELIRYTKGDANVNILVDIGFSSDLSRKEKTSFTASLLLLLKEKYPKSFATNGAHVHLDKKGISKAGFNDDRSNRPVYVKNLSDNLKEWFEDNWKYKTYYVPYQR
ncbi:MAG: GNAT family N-acetyltransferase [Candidatus Lokiarchaeota archaeon]|nr:GNAT family N-acetyltransferase [Candidatus Lokiarchaeota archaeon]